jgi:thiamine-phosphate pyrophosphorylase
MRSLQDCRLYGIVDLGYVKPEAVVDMTRALVEGGVDILQLRAKRLSSQDVETLARQMLPITRDAGVPFVINDHPEVAAAVGADGVHAGQDDLAVVETRAIVGASCFVGKSTHSLAQARAAMAEGADYIGFGPLYATGTKPDYTPIGLRDIAEVHRFATVPVFCIGGINSRTLPQVVAAGARRIVIVSAFLLAPDVRAIVRAAKAELLLTPL